MDRLACVDLPDLPMELLLARVPSWAGHPAVVIDRDKPQGEILWVNKEARRAGVLPGMRYAQGLSLVAGLRASEVPPSEIAGEVSGLLELLHGFSPYVEVSSEEPGVFWLDASGLSRLFPSLWDWAKAIHGAMAARGRRAAVVVGFRRFAVYAVAKALDGVHVLATPEEEEAALHRVELACLRLDPLLYETLARLGLRTLGDFLRLPAQGVRRRFGEAAHRLHALAAGTTHDPFVPARPEEPAACLIQLEEPEGDSVRLLFLVRRHLHRLLWQLAKREEAMRELEIRFHMDFQGPLVESGRLGAPETDPVPPSWGDLSRRRGICRTDRIRPADPTLDERLIMDLVRLRLEAVPLPAPASEMGISAFGAPAGKRQLQIFLERPRRDLSAADRALARLRAELGDEAVVRARLKEGHLPEARFAWEPLGHLRCPSPRPSARPVLVRRLYARAISLGTRPRHEPDGWIVRDLRCGPVVRMWGPYVVSGGWWRTEVHRAYYFLETLRGDILWVYYDGPRRRWFLHGQVE
jgi:protein ImuB